MNYDTTATNRLNAADMYQLETATAQYFRQVLEPTVDHLLSTTVRIADLSLRTSSDTTLLDAIVVCTYIENLKPINLDTVLMQVVQPATLTELLQNQTYAATNLEYAIRPHENTAALESVLVDNGRTKADRALVVAVSVLTIMVVLVSCLLLYVTGGWKVCGAKINNCLFMEVDDDDEDDNDYAIEKRATFQVQSYDEDDENSGKNSAPGLVTNPSGLLGDEENPAMGLGVKTPARGRNDDEDDSYMETPSGVPLGIQSVRKLLPPDTPEVEGGLSHLILKHRQEANAKQQKQQP